MPSEDPTKKSSQSQIEELDTIFSENLSILERENISAVEVKQVIEKLIELYERKRVLCLTTRTGQGRNDAIGCSIKMNDLRHISEGLKEESFTDEDRKSVVKNISRIILGGRESYEEVEKRVMNMFKKQSP